jgi:hypothetical protein
MSANGWFCVTFFENAGKQTRQEGHDDFAFILNSRYQRTRQITVRIFYCFSCDTENYVKEIMRRPRPTYKVKKFLK